MRTILSFLAALVAAAALAGCGTDPADDGVVSIVATTTQVADLARNVAGERAEVTGILAPNSDPHEYEPRPSDAEAVARADLILASGGEIDAWLDQVVAGSGSDAPVDELIDHVRTLPDPEGEGLDPHWWQDPRNAISAVAEIRDRLIEIDPGGRRAYAAGAASYIRELRELDARIAGCFERLPAAERKLVTSHDALGYYANRYAIEIVGAALPAQTTQAQPSAGETAALIELIRSAGVETIFPEAGVNAELEAAIAAGSGAEVGGELWADSLGPSDSDGSTYLEATAANTERIVAGLGDGEVACPLGAALG